MSLFRHHQGEREIDVTYQGAVDAVASRTGNRIFLHIANTDMNAPQELKLELGSQKIASARLFAIAAKADTEITQDARDCFAVRESEIEGDTLILPPAAVAAVEIEVA